MEIGSKEFATMFPVRVWAQYKTSLHGQFVKTKRAFFLPFWAF
jgi:hypothetical protein